MGDSQFANLSAPFQNAMPLDTHESVKSSSVPSSPNSLSNFGTRKAEVQNSLIMKYVVDIVSIGSDFHYNTITLFAIS